MQQKAIKAEELLKNPTSNDQPPQDDDSDDEDDEDFDPNDYSDEDANSDSDSVSTINSLVNTDDEEDNADACQDNADEETKTDPTKKRIFEDEMSNNHNTKKIRLLNDSVNPEIIVIQQ